VNAFVGAENREYTLLGEAVAGRLSVGLVF
jgi:hypothetical protein